MRGAVSAPGQPLRLSVLAIVGGALFAVSLVPMWNLSTRWFAIAIAGLVLVSVTLVLVRHLDDLMLSAQLFLLPLASIQKWLFLDNYPAAIKNVAVLSGAISIGINEILLVGIYALWFAQIFITRSKPIPRLVRLDYLILGFILLNILSMGNATDRQLSLFAVAHLVRHALLYFYLSRRLSARHLPWVFAAFAIAIAAEGALGLLQYRTGILSGIILGKGADSPDIQVQYEVPGIENITRATGTSYDSHAYGTFLTMLLPFPLALLLSARVRLTGERLLLLGLLGLGAAGVYASFSRSAWVVLVIVAALVFSVMLVRREKHIAVKTGILLVLVALVAPRIIQSILQRFNAVGSANLNARFDQYPVAWKIWGEHFFIGQGIGSYPILLDRYRPEESLAEPVHNVFLWLGADIGIFGAVTFYLIIFAAIGRLIKQVRRRRAPTDLWALGALAALTAYTIDGLTNPLFRESLVYALFWLMVALSVALPRIQREIDQQQRAFGR